MFKKIFPLLRDIAIVIGGNIIYACGVAFFILPGGLITGGTLRVIQTMHCSWDMHHMRARRSQLRSELPTAILPQMQLLWQPISFPIILI